ncbi:MAG: CHC2 zinc finger domain-containing protein [Galbitalea sp.]
MGEYVTLKNAGVGSMKGLCPFHEERSPSFHVRPQVGFYHCFGCGEGGDVLHVPAEDGSRHLLRGGRADGGPDRL